MFLTVFISVFVTLYVLFCIGLYAYHYLIEVILDLPITGQSPCTAHAALKQLVERLLKEAGNLPLLEKSQAQPTLPVEDNTNKNYEDLLATAIINKVISSCQNNLPSSSANSVSSRLSTSSRQRDDKEYFFGEETLDTKWKTTDLDTTSVSSLEEWMQSEASYGPRKYVDKVTLMIKQDIEEVDNYESDHEDDDTEYFRSSSSLFNDSESNWFLQRRQFQGTHSPVPVPMLVPNPETEAKVLIGDKPLDDTSDLSDVGSDFEEPIRPQSSQSILVQSKNVIGGGRHHFGMTENGDVHSESSTDSGVKEVNGHDKGSYDLADNMKADITVDDDNVEDSSFLSVYSNTEKEAEYTERFASLPRQIEKCSTPKSSHKEISRSNRYDEEDSQITTDFEFCGNYSKKEKEKWKHAVEMKNNPYSKENIEKRLSRSSSGASSLFGSDYYAKLAKSPSGGKQTSSEVNGVSWPPPEPPRDRTPSPPPVLPKTPPPPRESVTPEESPEIVPPLKDIIVPEPPKTAPPLRPKELLAPEPPKSAPPKQFVVTDGIHQAIQAIVTPVDENMPSIESSMSISNSVTKQVYTVENFAVQTNTSEVTSDSDVSYVNFYDVEHSQVFRKTGNEEVHIPIKSTPMGVSYKSISDENQNIIVSEKKDEGKNEIKSTNGIPVAKPRFLGPPIKKEEHLYVKATPAIKQRTIIVSKTQTDRPPLRRNLSESSLVEDSFDAPPKVLSPKKDNTLISKIYKDPKVRLFALHSREDTNGIENEYIKPHYRSQHSLDSKVIVSNKTSSVYLTNQGKSNYSSDDGLTSEYESGKTGKMSFFSSEEDLSLNSETSYKNGKTLAKNEDIKVLSNNTEVFRTPSPPIGYQVTTPRVTNMRKFIYGSQEDLLTIEEVGTLPKRKDNTIVSKIYQDSKVRDFALKSHGDLIPDIYEPTTPTRTKPRNVSSSDDDYHNLDSKISVTKQSQIEKNRLYSSYDNLSSADISLESIQSHHEDGEIDTIYHSAPEDIVRKGESLDNVRDGYNSEDIDVKEIEKRHLVRHTLSKFSKSEVSLNSTFQRQSSLEGGDGIRLSVRDLRKKFEENDEKTVKKVTSSLTARSLSKQMKESLKQ